MRYSQLLNELKIFKPESMDEYEDSKVIFTTIDGNVFIFDDEDDVNDQLTDLYGYDVNEIEDEAAEGQTFVVGRIEDNFLWLYSADELSPTSVLNKQIAKVVKQLDLYGVKFEDQIISADDGGNYDEADIETVYSRQDLIYATVESDVFYHGTDLSALKSIMTKGLMGTKKSNYVIKHDSKVFITTKITKAAYHAMHSATNNDSIPVILKLKVPDVSKLVLDYDVAVSVYGIDHPITMKLGYDELYHNTSKMPPMKYDDADMEEWKKELDKSSLNSKIGIFGYSGRIPASHILGFYVDENAVAYYEMYGDNEKSMAEMVKDSLDDTYKSYSDLMSDVNDIIDEEREEYDDED